MNGKTSRDVARLHFSRTSYAWLEHQVAARSDIEPVFQATYSTKQASTWFQRSRPFFTACGGFFATNGGQEWYVAHYLMRIREFTVTLVFRPGSKRAEARFEVPMTEESQASTSARLVSYLALVVTLFVLFGLTLAGVLAFQLVAAGASSPGGGFAFLFVTTWLLVLGVISIIVGGVGMGMAEGTPIERKRCWYAVAFGLVALVIGATFGVGFV